MHSFCFTRCVCIYCRLTSVCNFCVSLYAALGHCRSGSRGFFFVRNPHSGVLHLLGQERFSSMTRVYYKQATACVIIFDITRRATFTEVLKWKADLDSKARQPNGDPLPCLLIANKADLPERDVTNEEIEATCRENGSHFFCFSSFFPMFCFSTHSNISHLRVYRLGRNVGQREHKCGRSHAVCLW